VLYDRLSSLVSASAVTALADYRGTFIATTRSSRLSVARQTSAIPPARSRPVTSYGPSLVPTINVTVSAPARST